MLPRTIHLSAAFLKQTMCFRRKVRDARLSRSLLNGAAGCQLQQVARRDDARQVRPRKHVRHFFLPPSQTPAAQSRLPGFLDVNAHVMFHTFFPTRGPALPYVSGLQCPRFVWKSPAQLGGLVWYRLTVDGHVSLNPVVNRTHLSQNLRAEPNC